MRGPVKLLRRVAPRVKSFLTISPYDIRLNGRVLARCFPPWMQEKYVTDTPPTLYILCGLGFSGKTTWAKVMAEQIGAEIISIDAVYFEAEHEAKLRSAEPGQRWEIVGRITKQRIQDKLKKNISVILDDCSPRYEHRDRLRRLAKENNARAVVVYLKAPDEVLNARQLENKITRVRHDVDQHNLDSVRDRFEVPRPNENVVKVTPEVTLQQFLQMLAELQSD
jgi:predicted kinase